MDHKHAADDISPDEVSIVFIRSSTVGYWVLVTSFQLFILLKFQKGASPGQISQSKQTDAIPVSYRFVVACDIVS